MPTVIDTLLVEIGLDPTKFTKGQKVAVKSYQEAKDAAVNAGNAIEQSGKKSAEYLGLVQNKLLGVAGLVISGLGIDKLVTNITKQDAATGRLAYTLETTVGKLDRWRNAAYLAGGSSEGITGFIQGLTSEFQKFAITGESSLIPYFRGLGVQIADATGKMRPFDDIIHDVANAVAKLGPAQGAQWLRSIGADEGSINLIIKGGDELDRYLRLGAQFGSLTAEQAENAKKLAQAFAQLNIASAEWSRTLLNSVTPALIKLSEVSSSILTNRGNIDKRSIFGRLLDRFGLGKAETPADPSGAGGSFPSKAERLAFYRAEAAKRGISPDVVEQVVKSEGLNAYVGDAGSSFGDFQLHYGGVAGGGNASSGLGDTFTKKTGLDARDSSTWQQQAIFSLDQMKAGGLSPWHGWKGSPWAGIDQGGSGKSSDVNIENIVINTQATDAHGIASTIRPAIEKSSLSYQGQSGTQ